MRNPELVESNDQQDELDRIIRQALEEDVGEGDLTTGLLVPLPVVIEARILAKESGVMAGGPVIGRIFHLVDPTVRVKQLRPEGVWVSPEETVIEIQGHAQSVLTVERICLNFLGRCSGIATLTRQFVEAVGRWDVKIMDTRKTTPGLRFVERYAVRVGGGENHRRGLFDHLLVKDNHHRILERFPQGTLVQKIKEFRKTHPGVLVEIEVDNLEDLDAVLLAQPDVILLDNMGPDMVTEGVGRIAKRTLTEVSGGITLANVAEYARTGVDRISIGGLTRSARQIDYSLEINSSKDPQ